MSEHLILPSQESLSGDPKTLQTGNYPNEEYIMITYSSV
jgi:hypothetical protein